jgi:TRAP-type C4-dicarboxylate transport system permease large subunit
MLDNTNNWKPKLYMAGIAIGALVGLGTAYLLARTAEENGMGGPPAISTGDAIKSAIGVVGIMRGIASLGDK